MVLVADYSVAACSVAESVYAAGRPASRWQLFALPAAGGPPKAPEQGSSHQSSLSL